MNTSYTKTGPRIAKTLMLTLVLALPLSAHAHGNKRGHTHNRAPVVIDVAPRYGAIHWRTPAHRDYYRAPGYRYYLARPQTRFRAPYRLAHRHYHSRRDWQRGRYCDDLRHRRFDRYYYPSNRHTYRH